MCFMQFPVLWHGGQAVPDSSAIVTYLFNTYPKQMAIFNPPNVQAYGSYLTFSRFCFEISLLRSHATHRAPFCITNLTMSRRSDPWVINKSSVAWEFKASAHIREVHFISCSGPPTAYSKATRSHSHILYETASALVKFLTLLACAWSECRWVIGPF